MGNSRSTFAKNERDRNKKARKAAKIEKRLAKSEEPREEPEVEVVSAETQEVLIEKLRILHEDYENEQIDEETFEESKADLLSRLAVV